MQFIPRAVLALFLLSGFCCSAAETIVVPKDAPPRILFAAEELADYCSRITGRRPERALSPVPGNVNLILAEKGKTAFPPAVAEKLAKASSRDAFYLKSEGKNLYIAANTSLGVLFGVYAFLEDRLGVRWLYPGKDGEYVPRRATFPIEGIDDFQTPSFPLRMLLPVGSARDNLFDTYTWFARNRLECDMNAAMASRRKNASAVSWTNARRFRRRPDMISS